MLVPDIESKLLALADRNWHVHTIYSGCAAPEMTPERVLVEADRAGLRGVALVDHHHPGDAHPEVKLAGLKAVVGGLSSRVEVILGAELSAYGVDLYAETLAEIKSIDYRLYAGNHYRIQNRDHPERSWELPADRSPLGFKEHTLAILRKLIPSGRAHCIAHPFLGCYLAGFLNDTRSLTHLVTDDELFELFTLACRHGVAWEVSTRHLVNDLPFARRYLEVGFSSGADFRLGTDAHTLRDIDPRPQLDRLIRKLEAEPGNQASCGPRAARGK